MMGLGNEEEMLYGVRGGTGKTSLGTTRTEVSTLDPRWGSRSAPRS